jgi:hypothetical protein
MPDHLVAAYMDELEVALWFSCYLSNIDCLFYFSNHGCSVLLLLQLNKDDHGFGDNTCKLQYC